MMHATLPRSSWYEWGLLWFFDQDHNPIDEFERVVDEATARSIHDLYPSRTAVVNRLVVAGPWTRSDHPTTVRSSRSSPLLEDGYRDPDSAGYCYEREDEGHVDPQ